MRISKQFSISKSHLRLYVPLILILSIFQLIYAGQNQLTDTNEISLSRINNIIKQAQKNIWDKQLPNKVWWYPAYLGYFLSSEYNFEIQALGGIFLNSTPFNASEFLEILLKQQEEDGGWKQIINENTNEGTLDTSVVNYWFLKAMGNSPQSEIMQKAQKFIQSKGGIEACQVMTKFKLAAFGLYDWNKLYYIPLFLFKNNGFYQYIYLKQITAQWVWPHMIALAYLRYFKVIFEVEQQVDLKELYINPPEKLPYELIDKNSQKEEQEEEILDEDMANLINEIISLQQPKGSFGTYSVSTILSLLALKDFQTRYPKQSKNYNFDDIFQKGYDFIENFTFNKQNPYIGYFGDGRWWDTILVSWALLESGEDSKALEPTAQEMIDEALQESGGLPFGYDFEYAPDIDDTSLFVVFLRKLGSSFKWPMNLSVQWLFSKQNSDGGFSAFDKDKTGSNALFKFLFDFVGISGSAEIFDPSCADITGHNLEAFGEVGYKYTDPKIQKAIQYLIDTQEDFGSWQARWGINYIYSVGAVLPGLSRVGYNLSEPWVKKCIEWLLSKQNANGGFGEDVKSYIDPKKYNGVGNSTVTQTAWALLGLLEVYDIYEEKYQVKVAVHRAIKYLLDKFEEKDYWVDSSVVGTGHRGIIYLQYPSYPESFPLIAVSRYKNLLYPQQQEEFLS